MTRRLALLRMLGLLPATRYGSMGQMHRRPDQQTDAPPSAVAPTQAAGVLRARLVVVFGSKGSGIFVYSPKPGAGNLVASITGQAGTDPYGNAFSNGITSYAGGLSGILASANLAFTSGAAGTTITRGALVDLADATTPSAQPSLELESPSSSASGNSVLFLELQGQSSDNTKTPQAVLAATAATRPVPSTSALLEVQGQIQTTGLSNIIAAGGLQAVLGDITASSGNVLITTAAKGVVRTGETWHVVGAGGQPPFVNSFTAGGTAPRFQVEAVGAGRVRLSGAVNTGAVTGANTTIFTLPAGYVPTRAFSFATPNNVTAYVLGGSSIGVTTGGAVQLVPAGTAGKFVLLDGICFELD